MNTGQPKVSAGQPRKTLENLKHRTQWGRQDEPQFTNCIRNRGKGEEFFLQKAVGIVVWILARSFLKTKLWLRWKWSVDCMMLFVVIEVDNVPLACKIACFVSFSRHFTRFGRNQEWIPSWFREPVFPVICSIVSSEGVWVSGLAQAGKSLTVARPLCMGYEWMSGGCIYLFL